MENEAVVIPSGEPEIAMIVAMDKKNLIGVDNHLPWRLPADVKRFRVLTMGKPVLMGRKTYESIPPRYRPLSDRLNIVLTRQTTYIAPGCIIVNSPIQAILVAKDHEELYIIGGANLYELFLPQARRLYLTLVDGEFAGDTFFPPLDLNAWTEIFREEHAKDEQHSHNFTFVDLERRF